MRRFIYLMFIVFPFALSANTISFSGDIQSLGGKTGEIDDWVFYLSTPSQVEINVISDNGDPAINLFSYASNLSLDDFIQYDNNSGARKNSYLNLFLDPGYFQLRISEFRFGNSRGTNPAILENSIPDLKNTFSYDLDISGDQVSIITPVPEPFAFFLIVLGLFLVWLADKKDGKNK